MRCLALVRCLVLAAPLSALAEDSPPPDERPSVPALDLLLTDESVIQLRAGWNRSQGFPVFEYFLSTMEHLGMQEKDGHETFAYRLASTYPLEFTEYQRMRRLKGAALLEETRRMENPASIMEFWYFVNPEDETLMYFDDGPSFPSDNSQPSAFMPMEIALGDRFPSIHGEAEILESQAEASGPWGSCRSFLMSTTFEPVVHPDFGTEFPARRMVGWFGEGLSYLEYENHILIDERWRNMGRSRIVALVPRPEAEESGETQED